MNKLETLLAPRKPTAERPLLGLTVLVVEDSRYACEALRLMCLKSGARIRRAGTLEQARTHLRTYRPGVIIVDLGLPDGCGADLIRDLANGSPRMEVILASSGDADAEDRALAAGADGFLPKPLASLGAFQQAILAHLPADRSPNGLRAVSNDTVAPDPMALRDDLTHVADLLNDAPSSDSLDYVTQFVGSIAIHTKDPALSDANKALARRRRSGESLRPGIARLASAVQDHLRTIKPMA